jgi:hypothetical protein
MATWQETLAGDPSLKYSPAARKRALDDYIQQQLAARRRQTSEKNMGRYNEIMSSLPPELIERMEQKSRYLANQNMEQMYGSMNPQYASMLRQPNINNQQVQDYVLSGQPTWIQQNAQEFTPQPMGNTTGTPYPTYQAFTPHSTWANQQWDNQQSWMSQRPQSQQGMMSQQPQSYRQPSSSIPNGGGQPVVTGKFKTQRSWLG